uniref:Synaptotagmin like 3 n=1 Tax=Coturnix japonica TaxID=93934 RepID=A0A8C2TAB6_COTJA
MACEFNLNFLKELEREAVLEVLYRDQVVRKTEEERVRKLKMQLHQLRWKGARDVNHEYQERSCARCQKSLGLLLNRGAVCNGCSHRVCSECRVCLNPSIWKCTVCYAHGDLKVKAGEWFFEERAKKYPEEGNHWNKPCCAICSPHLSEAQSGSLYSLNSTCTESGNFGKANVTGEIEFAIRYIFKAGILEVCIRGCKNLAYGEDKKKKCNPYVKVYLLPDKSSRSKRKTAVKKNTVDPEFDETLKYKIERSQLGSRQLQISVWHAGALKYRVFLGEVVIPLAAWSFEDSSMEAFSWYQLQSKVIVNLCVVVSREVDVMIGSCEREDQEFSNCQLQVMIFGARNLPAPRSAGALNSFVKGCLIFSDQTELKQKSPVAKKEDCPQWKHLFVFDVTPAQLQQSCLHLTVWDQSTFGSRGQFLGGAKLGAKQSLGFTDPISPPMFQWEEVFRRPNTWVDFTLILHSNMENFKS